MTVDEQYRDMIEQVVQNGTDLMDRTGVGTRSIFGGLFVHDMATGFPLVSLKNTHWKSVVHELLWFISGNTNTRYLEDNGVRIWREWCDENGDLGAVYGHQWRNWGGSGARVGVDQLQGCIDALREGDYANRRLLVNSWDASLLPDSRLGKEDNVALGNQLLPPCHYSYQFNSDGVHLDLMWQQRSVDVFLGIPFNIASYALLLKMVADITGLIPRKLVGSLGNVHLYHNHIDQVNELLSRDLTDLVQPEVILKRKLDNIDSVAYDDILLSGYTPLPTIKAQVAV